MLTQVRPYISDSGARTRGYYQTVSDIGAVDRVK